MAKTIITVDSTCDLPKSLTEEKQIFVSPLYVRTSTGEYRDGVDIDPDGLFEIVRTTGELPKTAACSAEDYLTLWKPLVEAGNEVVHINLSSEMSSCHQNARLAAQELGSVYPVDSRSLSTGSGLLALRGWDMAREGKGAREISEALTALVPKLNTSFVLDTMDYLAKGGRCSSVTAFAASMLRLRLCIAVTDGKMDVSKKYRGKTETVLKQYVGERLSAAGYDDGRVFITETGVEKETVNALAEALKNEWGFKEVLHSKAGCTISSHSGPGCLGILFFNK